MRKISKLLFSTLFMITTYLPSYASISVSEPWARAGKPNSAGFMKLQNSSSQDRRVISAQTNSAKKTELHDHLREGDVFKMRQVRDIIVPAKGEVELMPGGKHVMFFDLDESVQEGQSMDLVLTLDNGEIVACSLPVKSMTYNPKLANSGCGCKNKSE